jgi:hypothetical protein
VEKWRQKFYSDKVKVEIGVGCGYERIWRKPGTVLQDRYLRSTFKGERVSAIFWAAMEHNRPSQLVFIWGNGFRAGLQGGLETLVPASLGKGRRGWLRIFTY